MIGVHQLANIQMPIAWRDNYINQQDPEFAQRLRDAREEDFEEAKAQILNKRRPATDRSDLYEEGSAGDIY